MYNGKPEAVHASHSATTTDHANASSVFLTAWPLFSTALTLTQRAGGLLTTHICLCCKPFRLWLIVHFCAACIFADLVYELGSKWQLAVFLQQWARFCLAIVTFIVRLPIPLGTKSADLLRPFRVYESFRANVNLLGRGRLAALLPLQQITAVAAAAGVSCKSVKADAWRAVPAVNHCGTSLGERFGSAVGVGPQCAHVLVSLAAAGAVLLMVPSNPMQAQHVSDAPGVVQDTVTASYSPVGPQPA
jgi:hypothetical protein